MDQSSKTLFASPSLGQHLVRGAIGFGAISAAIALGAANTAWWTLPAALALAGAALVAFRGCPVCWTIGLVETGYRSLKRS